MGVDSFKLNDGEFSTALMNADNKRTDMWWNIAKISWSTLLAMVVVGSGVCIWID